MSQIASGQISLWMTVPTTQMFPISLGQLWWSGQPWGFPALTHPLLPSAWKNRAFAQCRAVISSSIYGEGFCFCLFSSNYSFSFLQPWAGLLGFFFRQTLPSLPPSQTLYVWKTSTFAGADLHMLIYSHWPLFHIGLNFSCIISNCSLTFPNSVQSAFWCTIGLQIEISLGSSHFPKFP